MIINSERRPIEEMEIKSVIKNNNHRDILDNLFEGVYFTDINRRITFWNKGAEKLRLLIEKSSLNIGGAKIQVTISIGAALAQLTDTVETLVKRVDKLMYNSKSSGRNRVSMKFGIE
ncbi:diguanylate cyclase [candidate division WOR-3 bacterium]|nr:diguanylate cyclase [candidate division WOR-3 bacterium]